MNPEDAGDHGWRFPLIDEVHGAAAAFDQEMADAAMARVRQRVEPHPWEAFRLTAVEGLSGAEAARRLGIPVAHVFVATGRVQKRLRGEIGRQDDGG